MLQVLLSACVLAICAGASTNKLKCGYNSCLQADPEMLNVHIVPHTHNDVGWLKTVDQYYYGSRNNIQRAGVQYILDSVVKELWEDPTRRFMYVETAFFWKWWTRQTKSMQEKVQTLVNEGRLQFVGGAWSMNDEADTHYQSIIDQFTLGLRKLNDTFGVCGMPRAGWQIDPFGHSREFASLLAAMGYDGLFLGRIDYQDKAHRLNTKTMEMLWRGDDDLGAWSDIYTGVLFNTYSPPAGFCFDVLCSDEPIIDDVNSPIYNVDERVEGFLKVVKRMEEAYKSSNILITMGDDFQYQDGNMWFTNLDKLIKYTNLRAARSGLKIKAFYSTPDCYLNAVKESNPTLPTKQDDFFPYASDPNSYWTGYFTSRPTVKYFEREGNAVLQMAKQLQVLAGLEEHNSFIIDELRSTMGVMQHHDAITGTEKQQVASDYVRMLSQAIEDATLVPRQAFDKWMQTETSRPTQLSFDRCHLNESSCHVSETNDRFVITLYNPLSWRLEATPVRIPVIEGSYEVYAPNEDLIESQLIPIPDEVWNIPTRQSNASQELVFLALNVKPLGYKNYYVKKVASRNRRDTHAKRRINFYENVNDYWQRSKENKENSAMRKKLTTPKRKGVKEETARTMRYSDVKIEDNFGKVYVTHAMKEKEKEPEMEVNRDYKFEPYEVVKEEKKPTAGTSNQELEELEKLMKDIRVTPRPNLNGMNLYRAGETTGLNSRTTVAPTTVHDDERYTIELEELERLMKVTHATVKPTERATSTTERPTSPLPKILSLNAEETRMLGDEPVIIQMFPKKTEKELQSMLNKKTKERSPMNLTLITPEGPPLSVSIDMGFYEAKSGNNSKPQFRASGAYIFRPDSNNPTNLTRTCTTIKGSVVDETHCVYTSYAALSIRKYHHKSLQNLVEVEWLAGPIPVDDNIGKEIVISYRTSLQNNGEFYTDSNGRQMLKRKLDKRPQWNLTLSEPVAGNYYPVTNEIYIQDFSRRFVVLTDRPQGGTALEEGNIELMVHRRLLHDDAFGVDEALDETANNKGLVARGRHWLTLDTIKDNSVIQEYVLEAHLRPQIFISDAKHLSFEHWVEMKNCFGSIKPFPEGLHLLTLEPWAERKFLIRIENYLEKTPFYKSDREIDLATIFNTVTLVSLRETMLAGNRWLDESEKWEWDREDFVKSFNEDYGGASRKVAEDLPVRSDITGFKVKLDAKQIRTFVVDYEMKA